VDFGKIVASAIGCRDVEPSLQSKLSSDNEDDNRFATVNCTSIPSTFISIDPFIGIGDYHNTSDARKHGPHHRVSTSKDIPITSLTAHRKR
jgi:hypothetical protein